MKSIQKLAALLSYASLGTSSYVGKFEEIKEIDWNTTNNKSCTRFNPDGININYKIIPKNHKKFIIEGIEIYALSEKRAKEKFKKLQNENN